MSGPRIIRDLVGYTTSRDYAKLWELAHRQSVVCVVDSGRCRDIAHTINRAGTIEVDKLTVTRGVAVNCLAAEA